MSTYRAVARREGKYWVVTVEGVGVTQGRSLPEAQEMAEDLITVMTEQAEGEFEVHVDVALDEVLVKELSAARDLQAEAGRMQMAAAQALKDVVQQLRTAAGLSGRDTAFVLGVSEQRVSQLAAGTTHVRAPGQQHTRKNASAGMMEKGGGKLPEHKGDRSARKVPASH